MKAGATVRDGPDPVIMAESVINSAADCRLHFHRDDGEEDFAVNRPARETEACDSISLDYLNHVLRQRTSTAHRTILICPTGGGGGRSAAEVS